VLARHYVPGPPLAEFVELFWLYDGFAHEHRRERLLPTGSFELVVSLRDEDVEVFDDEHAPARKLRGIMLSGAFSKYFVIDTLPTDSVLGIHFKPGGAFPFIGIPAGELHDTHVSLEDLWGSAARVLREQLLAAPTPEGKFAVLERALIARARTFDRHPAIAYALRELTHAPHTRTIGSLTNDTGLRSTRFIELFARETGYTPKRFARVQRFQRVLQRIDACREVDWTDVALGCGYFDQSHFINDFRAFSGINPSTYVANRTPHRNHVPIR
jgi:AraC-like DNA-binding protein